MASYKSSINPPHSCTQMRYFYSILAGVSAVASSSSASCMHLNRNASASVMNNNNMGKNIYNGRKPTTNREKIEQMAWDFILPWRKMPLCGPSTELQTILNSMHFRNKQATKKKNTIIAMQRAWHSGIALCKEMTLSFPMSSAHAIVLIALALLCILAVINSIVQRM